MSIFCVGLCDPESSLFEAELLASRKTIYLSGLSLLSCKISRLVLYLSIPRYSLHPFLHSKTLKSIEILGQFCQMNEEREERNQIVAFNTSSYCIYDHIRGGIEEREVK